MRLRGIAGIAAIVVGILTLIRSTSCTAGDEVLLSAGLVGVLGAIWNDNPERGAGDRIAKFLMLVFMIGFAVFFMALILHRSRCL
jgi:hypothetical protein